MPMRRVRSDMARHCDDSWGASAECWQIAIFLSGKLN
jgi:hypothetical protein